MADLDKHPFLNNSLGKFNRTNKLLGINNLKLPKIFLMQHMVLVH